MVPDTPLRLAAVQKALEDIVAPVLPPDADFAREQLALIVRSLALVRKQIPQEYAFHVHDAHDFSAFGSEVAACLPDAHPARGELAQAIEDVRAIAPPVVPDRTALEQAVRALRGAIETAVQQAGEDAATLRAIRPVVLEHTRRQTLLERAWVADTGFDRDPASLPLTETILYSAGETPR
ncbi:hypothetical protein [Novosphingobium sp. fls2-241-R2A-195]|jgi:hypothetical protein|uniref:hypothetical protein n=1 Tax=Novosphingobium sp. fls2-241-R2A-195 TaxID=3040296 RepID=UPI00254CC516|nr:hypothetical protein [Novosphingobium sp. fls2-241-R2A-195]